MPKLPIYDQDGKMFEPVGYIDHAVQQLEYELRIQLKDAFITKYIGHKHFMFAWSLATARWGDCHKDFRQGKISKAEAAAIIRDAIEHQLIPQECAEFEYAELLTLPTKNDTI